MRKGIVLAGGSGTRLYPITLSTSKQLLPIYDKPMIYYSISALLLAGIREILLISDEVSMPHYQALLGDGDHFGVNLHYVVQPSPDGLAQAFILGERFIGNSDVCLVLGDNIFFGQGFTEKLKAADEQESGATIFGYEVTDPERYGIVGFDHQNEIVSIEEKPEDPKSNIAVTGLYFFDNRVVSYAKDVKPSKRGELEISCILNKYISTGELRIEKLGRGTAWLDTGTHASLLDAANFVHAIQKRQGLKIACLEEIGYRNGWISKEMLTRRAALLAKTEYGKYLTQISHSLGE